MTKDVLVAYATKHGSTREVAEAIGEALAAAGLAADVRPAAEAEDLAPYRAVVLGAPLYMGRWHGDALRFLRRYRGELESLPIAVFALGPIDESEKGWAGARKQLDRAVEKSPVEPVAVELFGGAVDPAKLRFPFSRMPAADVRDWEAIHVWAAGLPAALRLAGARERATA